MQSIEANPAYEAREVGTTDKLIAVGTGGHSNLSQGRIHLIDAGQRQAGCLMCLKSPCHDEVPITSCAFPYRPNPTAMGANMQKASVAVTEADSDPGSATSSSSEELHPQPKILEAALSMNQKLGSVKPKAGEPGHLELSPPIALDLNFMQDDIYDSDLSW
ncbi:unnamed protein product, partial [Protopolystoma xenopodis]